MKRAGVGSDGRLGGCCRGRDKERMAEAERRRGQVSEWQRQMVRKGRGREGETEWERQ